MSNLSVGQIIMDAQRLATRVKDLDALGSALLVEAEGNNRLVESLRQFQDDIDSLNRISNSKSNTEMVNRIQQQNARSSEIVKENRELKLCIEDYERTLEMIMQKYREHTTGKMLETKINFKELYNEKLWKIIREQREKINEMAAVMQRAASIDEEATHNDIEVMSRLRMENQTLRELLQISTQFGSVRQTIRLNELVEKAVQTETEDFTDELSLSGASFENTNNNTVIHNSASANTSLTTLAADAFGNNQPSNDNNNGPDISMEALQKSPTKKAENIGGTDVSTSVHLSVGSTATETVAAGIEAAKDTATSAT